MPGSIPNLERPSTIPAVACLLALVFSSRAGASDASSPIVTDRPSVTASSIVVPAGSFQAENGLKETSMTGQRTLDFPETLLRFGVISRTELRVGVPDYYNEAAAASGFGDIALGVKRQLGPVAGFDVSLVLALSLPTGAALFSSDYNPTVQLPWSHALSTKWGVAGMLSVDWPTVNGRRNTTGLGTLLFERQLTKWWAAFIEYAGEFQERGGPGHLLHFGTTYNPSPHQQIDFHLGVGFSSAAPSYLIGFGYSFRLQALRR